MSTFTNHNNLEVPTVGTKNWSAITAENFTLIEQGSTMKAVAGLTVSAHQLAYIDSNYEYGLAKADATPAESRWLGFVTGDINRAEEGFVKYSGYQKNEAWNFTPGAVYVSDTTSGAVTQVEPVTPLIVGWAIGTNELQIKPWSVPPDLVAADAGASGQGRITMMADSRFDSYSVAGSWAHSNSTSQHYILRYRNGTPSIGDWISYKAWMTAGRYTMQMTSTEYNDRGIWELTIDGVVKGEVDLYDSAVQWSEPNWITFIYIFSSGLKDIRLTCTGKNASSSNYYMFLTCLSFYRLE